MTRWLAMSSFFLLTTAFACKSSEVAPEPPVPDAKADDTRLEEAETDDAKTDDSKTDDARWGLEEAKEVPGGWTDKQTDAEGVVAAVEVAIRELRGALDDSELRLVSIRAAQSQVVAGVNYRLVLDVTGKGGPRTVAATIYRPVGKAAPKMTTHRVRE